MRDFERLRVWVEAFELSKQVYAICRLLPVHEQFGLAGQLRRSSVSVVSNIAEGAGRSGDREFARFVDVAAGSASELLTQLYLAAALYGVPCQGEAERTRQVRRMLWGLRRTLRS